MNNRRRLNMQTRPRRLSVLALAVDTVTMGPPAAAEAQFARPADLTKRDWAVFLLHTAAEVEHALLVQYLFSAYSIRPDQTVSEGVNTTTWQTAIIKIARQEMGHL